MSYLFLQINSSYIVMKTFYMLLGVASLTKQPKEMHKTYIQK